MKVDTFYMNEECELHATGETTTVSADIASIVITNLITCLMGECGRYEGPDYDTALEVLTNHGIVDDDFEPDYDEDD